jgi:DNA-binding MarR family transcriptional regulator
MRLSQLFRSKEQTRLLEYLIMNKGRVFNQSSLAESLGVSPTTIARVTAPLISEGLVMFERHPRGMKFFCLNEENQKTSLLVEFCDRLQKM